MARVISKSFRDGIFFASKVRFRGHPAAVLVVRAGQAKLYFKGTVATEAEKNEIWNAIKTIPTWQKDIVADIQVTGGPAAAAAGASSAKQTYTVKPRHTEQDPKAQLVTRTRIRRSLRPIGTSWPIPTRSNPDRYCEYRNTMFRCWKDCRVPSGASWGWHRRPVPSRFVSIIYSSEGF